MPAHAVAPLPYDPSMIPVASTLPPGMKCAIAECQKLRHVDVDGTLYDCCCKSHSIEYHKRCAVVSPSTMPGSQSPAALPSNTKCAIFECPNPRYRDPSGTLHECCGITHAMEHQRRQALMKRRLCFIVQNSIAKN